MLVLVLGAGLGLFAKGPPGLFDVPDGTVSLGYGDARSSSSGAGWIGRIKVDGALFEVTSWGLQNFSNIHFWIQEFGVRPPYLCVNFKNMGSVSKTVSFGVGAADLVMGGKSNPHISYDSCGPGAAFLDGKCNWVFKVLRDYKEGRAREVKVTSYFGDTDVDLESAIWESKQKSWSASRAGAAMHDVEVEPGEYLEFRFEVEGADEHLTNIKTDSFAKMIQKAVIAFPNFKVAATTLRNAKTATINDWSAILWYEGKIYESIKRDNLEIYDRVGGGDGFASGLIYGFLEGKGPQAAVEYGAAHGALAMTTPGDTSMVRVEEVEAAMKGKGARVIR
jgi:hypothetical protein